MQDVAEIEGDGDVDVLDEEQRTDGAGQPGQAGQPGPAGDGAGQPGQAGQPGPAGDGAGQPSQAGQPGQAGDGAQHAQAQVKQSDSIGYSAQRFNQS